MKKLNIENQELRLSSIKKELERLGYELEMSFSSNGIEDGYYRLYDEEGEVVDVIDVIIRFERGSFQTNKIDIDEDKYFIVPNEEYNEVYKINSVSLERMEIE